MALAANGRLHLLGIGLCLGHQGLDSSDVEVCFVSRPVNLIQSVLVLTHHLLSRISTRTLRQLFALTLGSSQRASAGADSRTSYTSAGGR